MARSGHCRTCGATIRPRAKDMSVAAASRLHYWKHHPEIMLGGQAKRSWGAKKKATKKAR
jgi:hypothetical protein